jgi:hypothetical protein
MAHAKNAARTASTNASADDHGKADDDHGKADDDHGKSETDSDTDD